MMAMWWGWGNQYFICIYTKISETKQSLNINIHLTFCTVHQAVTRFQPLFREISFSEKKNIQVFTFGNND